MKNIDEYYKDWCGESHITNSCHPVHDSSEACDFAEYYRREASEQLRFEKTIICIGILAFITVVMGFIGTYKIFFN